MRFARCLLNSLTLGLASFARAGHCSCGYSVPYTGQTPDKMVFTDSLKTDFTKIAEMGQADDWIRQECNVTAAEGRGDYGKTFRVENVFTSPESSHDTGLTLRVGAGVVDGAISAAELDTARLDMYHGSFRAAMKIPQVKGTCAAFFWVSRPLAQGRPPEDDPLG